MGARLQALAAAVEPGARVADIGTDHGRLLTLLRQRRAVRVAIGIDRSAAALQRTAAELADAAIELRRGDGLAPLRPGEVDTVVIAGMGAQSIIGVLERGAARWPELTRLVLQPAAQWPWLRAWIAARRFTLQHEAIVWDNHQPNLLCVVAPGGGGPDPGWDDDDLELGPLLRRRPHDPAYRAWLERRRCALAAALADAARTGAAAELARRDHARVIAALAAGDG